MDWSKDLSKGKTETMDAFLSCRVPQRYRDFVDKNKLSPAKIMMRACEELDNSLKETFN